MNLKHSKYYQKNRNWICPKMTWIRRSCDLMWSKRDIFIKSQSKIYSTRITCDLNRTNWYDIHFESDPTPNSRKLFGILGQVFSKNGAFFSLYNQFIGENYKLKLKWDSRTVRHWAQHQGKDGFIWYINRYGKWHLVNYSTEKNILKAIFSS